MYNKQKHTPSLLLSFLGGRFVPPGDIGLISAQLDLWEPLVDKTPEKLKMPLLVSALQHPLSMNSCMQRSAVPPAPQKVPEVCPFF